MPALPPQTSTLKVQLITPVTVHPSTSSRFFVHYAGTAPTAAQLSTFATAVGTAWGTNLASLYSTNTSLGAVNVIDLSLAGFEVGVTPGTAGTRAGTEAPISVCVEIAFGVQRKYRGGKPKLFLNAGVQADLADVSHWSTAFVNAMTTGWNNFITAVLAAGWTGSGVLTQVNAHYYKGFTTVTRLPFRARNVPTIDPAGVFTEQIITTRVQSLVGSQRRRRVSA